jgi:SAM-dependent methyltransferase
MPPARSNLIDGNSLEFEEIEPPQPIEEVVDTFINAKRIAGYNWPLYAAAAVAVTVAVSILLLPAMPAWLKCLAAIGIVVALWYTCASFWAFHLMFDRSGLLTGEWLLKAFPVAPKHWVEINAGLAETTIPLQNVFPEAQGTRLDIFDPASMTEPAITRARHQLEASGAISAKCDALPVSDAAAELVLVMLAAHEIRDRQAREQLFGELTRIVSPTGKIILVEHLRDLPAFLAFGPGFFHFFPRSEWLDQGRHVALRLESERSITPYVRVFVFCK